MNRKSYLKIMAVLVLFLMGYGTVSKALAGEEKRKSGYHSSIQVSPSEKDEAKLSAATKITADQAKAAAIEKHKAWPVKYVEIRNLKGNLVYEVEFQDDKEIFVDAGTGEILTKPQDDKKK
jgi:uncharacterized membrane protein YkoI